MSRARQESGVKNPRSNGSHFLPGACGLLAGGGLWDPYDPDPVERLKKLFSDAAKFLKPDWDPVRGHQYSLKSSSRNGLEDLVGGGTFLSPSSLL